ncbi:hypothetical protein EIN_463500 [Entamoeba invadens IP1]|uniref:small monomeric GTPase n=1 Tax=Entamoeba invadens IP1 TaxID=370355 RepID=L7FKP4_ENTIV|nr:hypothetical protein EIN_463500 [Entamoeba invadens IP1]ELP87057.1 hypothetical protein EIN_463500 [Entamoeba invadens IP1]|eukprot:XP_004253828.1 hypothetical protein EIN_463500 [Entamoeba invadens IP1]
MSQSVKIVMLGGGAVGKSALTVQEVSGHFLSIYDPTIEDSYRTSISIDGNIYTLEILDTAGQEEYMALRDSYIRGGDGYVLVYSITSQSSFLEANAVREQIYRILDMEYTQHIPIILVGNKCDLESERRIQSNEAQNIANEWKISFIECSAKNKINVTELFQMICKDVVATRESKRIEDEKSLVGEVCQKGKKTKHMKNKCNIF